MSFDAFPHDAWPGLALALSLPWPREAAEHDLRWHAADHAVHGRPLPNERALAARWGWRKTRVHDLIASTSWADAARPWRWRSDQTPTKLRPNSDQGEQANAEESPNSDQDPTKIRPRSDLTRDPLQDHPSPITHHQKIFECVQPPAAAGLTPTPEAKPEAKPDPEPQLPAWVPAARLCGGHLPADVAAMVLAVIAEVRQAVINSARCATDAKCILALWRALGRPPPSDLAAELVTVAAWARSAPDKLAARDIRAEGWPDGVDRHRDVATLCRQDRWQARLDAAQSWQAAGRPEHDQAKREEDRICLAIGLGVIRSQYDYLDPSWQPPPEYVQ
jgi:hypothetical protein